MTSSRRLANQTAQGFRAAQAPRAMKGERHIHTCSRSIAVLSVSGRVMSRENIDQSRNCVGFRLQMDGKAILPQPGAGDRTD